MRHLRPALVLMALFTGLTGIIFPLAFTGVATELVPSRADGSLVMRDGRVVGSILVGQNFTSTRYFWGRPSATTDADPNDSSKTIAVPYDANSSGGSNLGPTSKALLDRVRAAVAADGIGPVPGDMVTTSASGLDPDISPENAAHQIGRVAAARALPPAQVRALVLAHTQGRLFGLIGKPRVNVLTLNLALDRTRSR
jgi:potassium-transporting ATPase KdpC subunit